MGTNQGGSSKDQSSCVILKHTFPRAAFVEGCIVTEGMEYHPYRSWGVSVATRSPIHRGNTTNRSECISYRT